MVDPVLLNGIPKFEKNYIIITTGVPHTIGASVCTYRADCASSCGAVTRAQAQCDFHYAQKGSQ